MWTGIIIGALVVFFATYSKMRKRTTSDNGLDFKTMSFDSNPEKIESLSFVDITSWFKSLKLNEAEDIAFLINGEIAKEKMTEVNFPSTTGKLVILAVYNKKANCVTHSKSLDCNIVDDRTQKTLEKATNGFIVLGGNLEGLNSTSVTMGLDGLDITTSMFCNVVDGKVSFERDIVNWFKPLKLQKNKDIPFIMKGNALREQLPNVQFDNVAIMEAVYDEKEQKITACRLLIAESIDNRTMEVLSKSKDGIVVLN